MKGNPLLFLVVGVNHQLLVLPLLWKNIMSPWTQRQSSDGEAVAPSEGSEVESLTSELPSSVVTGRRLGVGGGDIHHQPGTRSIVRIV